MANIGSPACSATLRGAADQYQRRARAGGVVGGWRERSQRADRRTSQAGYVLPWESAEIAGWRKSLDDIAQFVFTDLPDSYAARTGRPANVGVVGIAVFREYQPPRPQYAPPLAAQEQARDSMAKSMPAPAPPAAANRAMAEADAMPQQLGTGHGQREWAPVGANLFQRMSTRPQQVSQVRYDDANALVAMGILPRLYRGYADNTPRAFPQGFVPDPR